MHAHTCTRARMPAHTRMHTHTHTHTHHTHTHVLSFLLQLQQRHHFDESNVGGESPEVNSLRERAVVGDLASAFRQAERLSPGITDMFVDVLCQHIRRYVGGGGGGVHACVCCHQDGSMEATWSWETIEFGICTVVISHSQPPFCLNSSKDGLGSCAYLFDTAGPSKVRTSM